MNADKFFETHTIEEISKKTKISPISLRLIRNREFDKIPKVKFIGFVNILQKTYKTDLSDLIEEYNQTLPPKPVEEVKPETSNNSTFLLSIAAFILLLLGGYLFYSYMKTGSNKTENLQNTAISVNSSVKVFKDSNETNETNITKHPVVKTDMADETNFSQTAKNNTEISKPQKTPAQKKSLLSQIEIIPHEKLWFRALNIDTNKSIEYLTSNPKILPKGNYYIKFGHGNLSIIYNDQNITPNTKKIIRILFKDGNYTYMKKPNRFEK